MVQSVATEGSQFQAIVHSILKKEKIQKDDRKNLSSMRLQNNLNLVYKKKYFDFNAQNRPIFKIGIHGFRDFTHCSGVSIVDFEQVNADWDIHLLPISSLPRVIDIFSHCNYKPFISTRILVTLLQMLVELFVSNRLICDTI